MGSPSGLYGTPPADLAETPAGAVQFSPLIPGSAALEAVAPGSLAQFVMLAPPGTLERRYALALALSATIPSGQLTILAPNNKGGGRLGGELKAFGCTPEIHARRHHRICFATRPDQLTGIEEAIAAGQLQIVPQTSLWSQPGVFSWDRTDPGSALLASVLPVFSGKGADLGCGIGYLARQVIGAGRISEMTLVDMDARAIAAARKNVADLRASFVWADVRSAALPENLDFVVMNPPFHDGGEEDRALGQAFIRRAAAALHKGGACWLVANRHLPYEHVLHELFQSVRLVAEQQGFKVYEALK